MEMDDGTEGGKVRRIAVQGEQFLGLEMMTDRKRTQMDLRMLCGLMMLWMTGGGGLVEAQIPAPPLPPREMRATWIATVANINWPRDPDASVERQKAELLELLDSASAFRLNGVVLQVRPAGDALYRSTIEPWSPYLTGKMGRAPDPMWDPLEFAIEEAHKRGMELHAWFNPFRASLGTKWEPSEDHVIKQHPEWIFRYGANRWMDPGIAAVRQRAVDVILDVTKRYDVDGIHIDDYFYPYPEKGASGTLMEFPDEKSYAAYQAGGGKLDRPGWRRQNVDETVKAIYEGIKAEKRWVKFGISPFGLWRPNHPEGMGGGLDPYEQMGADSRKWLQQGWLDYLTPQLYWPIEPAKLSFTRYYDWWLEQNTLGRHIWPGMASSRVGDDRVAELRLRGRQMMPGHFHWNFDALHKDQGKLGSMTKERAYGELALPPPTPWLSQMQLPKPVIRAVKGSSPARVNWVFEDERWLPLVRWWVVQTFEDGKWSVKQTFRGADHEMEWPEKARAMAVRAAGRGWELGPATAVAK